jgi:Spy/CpxP family protein refolding chaperone
MKKLMSTIGVIALLMGTSFAQDAAPSKEMRQGKQGKHQAMLEELPDLTENQKAQIKDIREESREKMEPQREDMKKLRSILMELK